MDIKKMKSIILGTLIIVLIGDSCSGDECKMEVVLEPMGAVTTKGSKVRFACSIPQCVTANHPDTKFRMEHNGTAFGEVTKTHEYKNGYSLAFFEKHFNSPSDAGSYKCKVASNGQHQNETGVDVTFLHAEDRPTIVRLKNGTNTISCLGDSSDSPDLVMAWGEQTKSCDRSENTITVELKSLKEVDRYRECDVTSTKACTHYGNVKNATSMQAGVMYRKYILAVEIKQERAGDRMHVTAFVFGPGASAVETSWEMNGTELNLWRNETVSDNQTVTGVIVNETMSGLQLVLRQGSLELGRVDVLLEEKPGPNGAEQLKAGPIAGIIFAIVITVLGILFIVVFLYRKKQFCFRKTETHEQINQGGSGQDSKGNHNETEEDVFVDALPDHEAVGKHSKKENSPGMLKKGWDHMSSYFKRNPSDINAVQNNIDDPESVKLN